ncbi:hypothetical protein [Actinomadura sp. HBU206391]|uniref:hypothetical protein n=1 Tax=Actinomadura sp. HBU206391 TaxID=2731692 RepID=UPI00164F8EE6|nr:hypothetical protein [Actinomadura sp. HBU206391]MBC6457325.1 hypothetical protein [Actinomadura sp. HBU206391]
MLIAVGALALRDPGAAGAGNADAEQGVNQALQSTLGYPNTPLAPPSVSPSAGPSSGGPSTESSRAQTIKPEDPESSSSPRPDGRSGPGSDTGSDSGSDRGSGTDPGPEPGSGSAPEVGDTSGARAVMQAWLRGLGNGDTSICARYASEDFADRAFGSMDRCRYHVAHVDDYNRRDEVRALRTTTVVGGTFQNGTVVVRFSDLRWSSGYMTADTTQEQHRLGVVNGDWKILG